MRPHAPNLGDAGSFELVPYCATTIGAKIKRVVVRWNCRNCSHEDGIIPVHHRVDADLWCGPAAAGVVAGPFSERPLLNIIVGMNHTLECNFGIARHGQPGFRHVEDFDWLPKDTAGSFQFILAVRYFQPTEHE